MGLAETWIELAGATVGLAEAWIELAGFKVGLAEAWIELAGFKVGLAETWMELAGAKVGLAETWSARELLVTLSEAKLKATVSTVTRCPRRVWTVWPYSWVPQRRILEF